MPECRCCAKDTTKRRVLKRKPLVDITDQLPKHPEIIKEYLCVNEIETKHPWFENGVKIEKWFKEICENHVCIVKLTKRGKYP